MEYDSGADDINSGDIGSGDIVSGDSDDGLKAGQVAAVVVSAITAAVVVGLLVYYLVKTRCPITMRRRRESPAFSPIVSLASQPIVVTTSR